MDDAAILESITKLRANRSALERLRENRSARGPAKGKAPEVNLASLMSGITPVAKDTNEKGGE